MLEHKFYFVYIKIKKNKNPIQPLPKVNENDIYRGEPEARVMLIAL